jgi:hypothetical protein
VNVKVCIKPQKTRQLPRQKPPNRHQPATHFI